MSALGGPMKTKLPDPSRFNLFVPFSILSHFLYLIKVLISWPFNLLGVLIIILGLMVNNAASSHLRRNRTPIGFSETPERLVTDGPFRISRNPIYLGGVMVLLGLAVLLGSLASFLFPMLLFLLLHLLFIPAEENQLEEEFGPDYIEYRRSLRRWL
jgi:protein-S-isoprenylcysteine O-methyltransferase Ste14